MFLGDTLVPHKFSLGEVSRVVTISHQLSTAIHLDSLQKNGASQKIRALGELLKNESRDFVRLIITCLFW